MDHFSSAKYILAIADAKNISAAAEKMGISQPALSAQLRKIEDQLGIVLFDRTKHPLEVTEAGEVYLTYAQRHQVLNREFSQHMADLENLTRGHLTIGGAGSFNISYLPAAVAQFSKRYPGVEIEIIDGNIPDITAKAIDGEMDLFIAPPWKRDDRLQYEALLKEKIFLCVPPEWQINEELRAWRIPTEAVLQSADDQKKFPQVDFTAFREHPFILLKEDQHIGQIMAQLFAKYGFRPEKCTLAEQTMTSYSLTLAGVGISLMTESTIRSSNFREFPAFYMPDADICKREMYAVYSGQKYLSRAAGEFIRILKSTLQCSGAAERVPLRS